MERKKSLRVAWSEIARKYPEQVSAGEVVCLFSERPFPPPSEEDPNGDGEHEQVAFDEANPDNARAGWYRFRVTVSNNGDGTMTCDEATAHHAPPAPSKGDDMRSVLAGWRALHQESVGAREQANRTLEQAQGHISKLHAENFRLQKELREAHEKIEALEQMSSLSPTDIATAAVLFTGAMKNGGAPSEEDMKRAASVFFGLGGTAQGKAA